MYIQVIIEVPQITIEEPSQSIVNKFFEFCRKESDFLSITRAHSSKLTNEQLDIIKKELEYDLLSQINDFETNRNGYANRLRELLYIETADDAKNYFQDVKKDNKKIFREIKRNKFQDKGLDIEMFKCLGMLKIRTTCITPSTKGPLVDILFFRSDALKEVINSLPNIFSPITIGDYKFEDLTFYKNKCRNESANIKLLTHEEEGELTLNEESFKKLEALGLPYKLTKL